MADVVGVRLLLPGGAPGGASDGAASLLQGCGRLAPLGEEGGGARVGARFADEGEAARRVLASAAPRLVEALGPTGRLAFAAGLLLLEDLGLAGSAGWALPPHLRDGTGVVYSSALAGDERPAGAPPALGALLGANEQLAQQVGARGPNCAVSAACAGAVAALKVAHAFLAAGDADRVLVVVADLPLHRPEIVAAFLEMGAATPAPTVAEAALPFGANRSGLVFGEAAAAFLLERPGRAPRPAARVAGLCLENSAFHGTRIDTAHVAEVIGKTVARVAAAEGLSLAEFAEASLYVAHETFTRLCSAAEVAALEKVFGRAALRRLPIVGTKWLTGHCMAAGAEDAVAIAALGAATFPPAPRAVEVDPAFADLLLCPEGPPAFRFAMHLSLGFGSQVGFVVYAAPPSAAPGPAAPAGDGAPLSGPPSPPASPGGPR